MEVSVSDLAGCSLQISGVHVQIFIIYLESP